LSIPARASTKRLCTMVFASSFLAHNKVSDGHPWVVCADKRDTAPEICRFSPKCFRFDPENPSSVENPMKY
ncbi:MAG: hypothetical protein IJZ52_04835, partial [Clostridium sp.]|nr:hypothetical protein [Clostridium sp.]